MGMKLFNDDGDDSIDVSKIEIDAKFARRYEHNKKREALHRYQELKRKGQIEDSESESKSESETESEGDEAEIKKLSKKKPFKEFINNLIKVKERHPSIYQKDVKLFESESDSDDEEDNTSRGTKKKNKAVYLKDVRAQQLIEEGPEFDDGELGISKIAKTYNEEQEELRREFLEAVKDAAVDGDLLKVKEKGGNVGDEEEEEENDDEFDEKLNNYFGAEEELDEASKFLKEFIQKRMWVDRDDKDRSGVEDDEVGDLLRDDEEIERQEKYEECYNFRHEENAGDRIFGHSRIVEGSVRKKDNARKEQRKSKKERMEIAEKERKEELKHLKNLKKKEMNEKLMKVMQAAGVSHDSDFALDLDDLKKDFDPEEYDKMMNEAFSEEYYNNDDVDPGFGSENDDVGVKKPDFDEEDKRLGLPAGWDEVDNDNEGFLAVRERILKQRADDGSGNDDKNEEEGEERNRESKRKRKRKMSFVQKVKEEWLEEYYKLDYEGAIGDLKTRFKYAKVKRNGYGLKTEDILMLDDPELSQYVSVKNLAPYRDEWKVHKNKRDQIKEKIRELRRGRKNHQKQKKSRDNKDKSNSVVDSHQDGEKELEGSDMKTENLSRKAKRNRHRAEYKLTKPRLAAYQNIQSKGKGKGKN